MIDQESVKHSLYENGYGLTVVEVGQLNYGGILRRSISSPHGYYDFVDRNFTKRLTTVIWIPEKLNAREKDRLVFVFWSRNK